MTVTFDAVTEAVDGGADTYRKIADRLGVPLDDPDLATAINFMRSPIHNRLAFADNCGCTGIEHWYDCRLVTR